jgi:hypothetical protein
MKITRRNSGRLLAAVALGTAAAWCSAPAWAANASDLTVTLAATPDIQVSVSRQNLNAYIAYRVTLGNSGGNTINQVSLTGTTTPNGTTAASFYGIVSNGGIVPSCGPIGAVAVTCTVGQMKAGTGSDFFLLFQTPTDGSAMHFHMDSTFSEGNSPNTPPVTLNGRSLDDDVVLTTTDDPTIDTSVIMVLPPVGGPFFTGPNGAVSSSNPFSTSVTLKDQSLVTRNSINETTAGGGTLQCDGAYFCYGLYSRISVTDAKDSTNTTKVVYPSGKPISIILRQDISSLSAKKPVPKIGDVHIYYNPNPPPDTDPPVIGNLVPPCSAGLPAQDQPCVSGRTSFVKGQKGYYQYEIQALDNGKFSW